ncbi:folylpolyglutamate synthase, mitochondrial-like, partial [Saccoglossus kowalevskii]|uniref:Folylpolyglutamate synthase, mitochondrial-like n=1 Tax=Saccoglossus kowalevskii TaxID=10224 RepID=A0ABM0LZS2_SACKO
MCTEPFLDKIRNKSKVTGLAIPNSNSKNTKLTAYAGDIELFITNNEDFEPIFNNPLVLHPLRNEPYVLKHFVDAGITELDDIDGLNIIHISGTKGKGSVSAFCESILRAHGLKTGFYSSPHLIEVRERFRINGVPLTKEKFSKYFFEVYRKLESTMGEFDRAMPVHLRFLTIMAWHTFIQENVDVVILEVGMGGTYDCTNVVRRPTVTGINLVDFDHTKILGNTLDKIAWHKAGICKPGRPAFTVPQSKEATDTIIARAKELH